MRRTLALALLGGLSAVGGAGCICFGDAAGPGPLLASTADGRPAVGWEVDPGLVVRHIRIERDGVVEWWVRSRDGDAVVLPVGGSAAALVTEVAAPAGFDPRGADLVVEYLLDGEPQRGLWHDLREEQWARSSPAEVRASGSCAASDWDAAFWRRGVTGLALALSLSLAAGLAFTVLGLWGVSRVVRRRDAHGGPVDEGAPDPEQHAGL